MSAIKSTIPNLKRGRFSSKLFEPRRKKAIGKFCYSYS